MVDLRRFVGCFAASFANGYWGQRITLKECSKLYGLDSCLFSRFTSYVSCLSFPGHVKFVKTFSSSII